MKNMLKAKGSPMVQFNLTLILLSAKQTTLKKETVLMRYASFFNLQ